ncbi:MAG: two-component system nitrogen regulation sensor histidine kinase GlnL [Porticoccus sp.]|jgi:two-component system nitrogen regulation sensor histidine kinase GlnL
MNSDNLHRRLLDNLATAVLLLDSDLNISYLNTGAEITLKVSANRVVGNPFDSLFPSCEISTKEMLNAIHSGSPFTKRQTLLTLHNGSEVTVDCSATPIAESDVLSLLLELQPLDRILKISREEGIISNQETTRTMIRGLAHEIKNPLGGLRGAAQLLARELPDAELTDYTDVIIEEADRLSNLVDKLLGSHKPQTYQNTNLHEILERVITLISAETSGKIEFERDYDPSIPDVLGDNEQLIQAVLNITRNAMQSLQSNPDCNQTITIVTRILRQFTIGKYHHRHVIKIDICDVGPGVPKQLLETVFMPMVSGRAEGTGLGLSISQSVINRHQGLIECESKPGNTRFSLYIPLEPVNEPN